MNRLNKIVFGTCLAVLTVAAPAAAQEKLPDAKVVSIEVRPAALNFANPYGYAQLVVTGKLETGELVDLTRLAKVDADDKLVKLSPTRLFRPAGDGTGTVKISYEALAATVPVNVAGQKATHDVSFVGDVMPVISRLGCNAGTCHGSAQGRNGFQLSLRGYDPLFDHRSLTDDVAGRRFNRADPERSLMLMKPSGAVPHVGGVVMSPGDPSYELLKNWIAQGVKLDLQSPRVIKLEVQPVNPVLPLPRMKQQMTVLATYADGKTRDVTAEAFLESSNGEVATVDRANIITGVRRGETAVLARYEGSYAAAGVIVMGDRSGFAWKETPEFNWIDGLVYDKLKQVKVLPSKVCSDDEFLRRVTLDLTGLPPTPEQTRAFLADSSPTKVKRDNLINKLIGSPDYVEHWSNKWADLLQVNRKFLGDGGARALRGWIRKSVEGNMPYDKFANALLTGTGSTMDNPPAAYYKVLRDAPGAMENTTHLFLAVRFNCNKRHDHPFERWTQTQYYTLSAYFAQIERREDPKYKGQKLNNNDIKGALPLVELIGDAKAGELKDERTGATAKPAFPFLHADLAKADLPRRLQLAQWITSKENPYFAKSYVNRVWSYLLGVGLIEPVDDIRAGNPPSNPKLLDKLTREFIDSGFNVQQLIRTICQSRTYQHSIDTNVWNKDDEINYSHALARRLPAEVLFDAIHRVTGSPSKLPGLPPGARAAELVDSNVPNPFLDLFGRPARESACECERSNSMLLGPVLNLINGPVLADALKDPNNRINKLAATEKNDAKLIEEIFIAVWSRPPTKIELEKCLQEIRGNEGEFKRLAAESKVRADALAAYEKTLIAKQAAWEKSMQSTQVWTVLDPLDMKSAGGAVLKKLPDGSILASGKNPTPEVYTITAKTNLTGITGIRLEVLTDDSLPKKGPGRAANGNFVLTDFKLEMLSTLPDAKPKAVAFTKALADFSQDTFPVKNAIDADLTTGWAIAPQLSKNHVAAFETKGVIGYAGGTTLTFKLDQRFAGKDHNIGRFRLSVTTMKQPIQLQSLPDNLAKILQLPVEQRSDAQKATLANYYRSLDPELARLQRAINEIALPPDARTMAAQDIAWALINSPDFLFNH